MQGPPAIARPVQVHQVLATLAHGDAIGNEAIAIQRILRSAGFRSDIFVETAQPAVAALARDYRELRACSSPDHVLLHHFSIGSQASRLAFALPDRMALLYHNVTPAHYFLGVNDELADRCYRGRRELSAYPRRVQLALADSEFNRSELDVLGFSPTAVLPVVPDFGHLALPPDPVTRAMFDDDHVNVLFVGRVITNKKIEDLLLLFDQYSREYNRRSRLLVVGSWQGFEPYRGALQQLAARRGIANIHLAGHVSNAELAAYYAVADVFLCASEHEGFCVPIVESFYEQVPVIAYAATAVPATMDGGGVLYDCKDPALVAGLIHAVVEDEAFRRDVLDRQAAALDRLVQRDFRALLLGFVDDMVGGRS